MLVQMSGLLHSLEIGTLRLQLCQLHLSLIEAVRNDTATALTALSGLIFASVSGEPRRVHHATLWSCCAEAALPWHRQ